MSNIPEGSTVCEGKLRPEVVAIEDWIIDLRRHFHQHPELSWYENKTSARIISEIEKLDGFTITKEKIASPAEGIEGTGLVATLQGTAPGAEDGLTIGLRADMDALPVRETNDLKFKSENESVMHACGHDGHMAGLLGAARVLSDMRDKICGRVVFLFQPAEEYGGGAKYMIRDGCMEGIDEIYGIHLWSMVPVGGVLCVDGTIMASVDTFKIHIKGKGGHGAVPHETIDPVMIQAQIINTCQTIVSRNISPCQCGVVTFGKIEDAGFASNVIPTQLTLVGTARAFNTKNRDLIRHRLQKICEGFSIVFECEISVEFLLDGLGAAGYPPTINHTDQYNQVIQAAEKCSKWYGPADLPTMGAEDFSYYLQKKPGCFFFISAAKPDGQDRPHHSSLFDIDESALALSSSMFVQIVDDILIQGDRVASRNQNQNQNQNKNKNKNKNDTTK